MERKREVARIDAQIFYRRRWMVASFAERKGHENTVLVESRVSNCCLVWGLYFIVGDGCKPFR